jgi:hypothetical protein
MYVERDACANCRFSERVGSELYLWSCTIANGGALNPVHGHGWCPKWENREGMRPSALIYASPRTYAKFCETLPTPRPPGEGGKQQKAHE